MVGGDDEPVQRLEPIFKALAPQDGYSHVGPSGAGHFVKMVHNGIEYGLMQAYGEGFEIMRASEFDLDLHEIAGIWRYGSVVRSWLLELLHAALRAGGQGPREDRGLRRATRARAAGRSSRRSTRACRRRRSARRSIARFASRQDESFAAKVAAALRNQFGGHAVKPADKTADGRRRREPAARGPHAEAHARPVRVRDLRRLRRPHPPQALPGALLARAARGCCPERFAVLGVARTEETDDEFRDRMKHAVQEFGRDKFNDEVWQWLAERDALRRRPTSPTRPARTA